MSNLSDFERRVLNADAKLAAAEAGRPAITRPSPPASRRRRAPSAGSSSGRPDALQPP